MNNKSLYGAKSTQPRRQCEHTAAHNLAQKKNTISRLNYNNSDLFDLT